MVCAVICYHCRMSLKTTERTVMTSRKTHRTIVRQVSRAATFAEYVRAIQMIDALPVADQADGRIAELRGEAVIARTNLVQRSVAVAQEGRNARLGC